MSLTALYGSSTVKRESGSLNKIQRLWWQAESRTSDVVSYPPVYAASDLREMPTTRTLQALRSLLVDHRWMPWNQSVAKRSARQCVTCRTRQCNRKPRSSVCLGASLTNVLRAVYFGHLSIAAEDGSSIDIKYGAVCMHAL
jgi:hypothetical protein